MARIRFAFGSLLVNDEEWIRCQHRPSTLEYELNEHQPLPVAGRESCAMMGARPLLAGDRLRVVNSIAGHVATVSQAYCTYFGIVMIA